MTRRVFQLFRAWIPSWRFFETLSDQPVLFYRNGAAGDEMGEWCPALTRPPRTWYSIALNGAGNRHLACYALLDQLEEDIGEFDPAQIESFVQSTSYQLVQNLICVLIRERHEQLRISRYQFKVSRMLAGGLDAFEEILVSPVHRV